MFHGVTVLPAVAERSSPSQVLLTSSLLCFPTLPSLLSSTIRGVFEDFEAPKRQIVGPEVSVGTRE